MRKPNWDTYIPSDLRISVPHYRRLLAEQNYRCAICEAEAGKTPYQRLYVDKQLATGRIRGLLCLRCKHGAAQLDRYLIEQGIAYFEAEPQTATPYSIQPSTHRQDYDRLFEEQGGCCAVCGESAKRRFEIDHCHKNGMIRGLLCQRCNMGLGYFHDSPQLLRRLLVHLQS
jgi:hypothetical protein